VNKQWLALKSKSKN